MSVAQLIQFPSQRRQPARLLTLAEVREMYGFSERWWRYRIQEGLPCRKWAGGLRFDADEVRGWLDGRFRHGA